MAFAPNDELGSIFESSFKEKEEESKMYHFESIF
jgi:hypothetical protein